MKVYPSILLKEFINFKSKKLFVFDNGETANNYLKNEVVRNNLCFANFELVTLKTLAKDIVLANKKYQSYEFLNSKDLGFVTYDYLLENKSKGSDMIFDLIPVESLSLNTAEVVYETIANIGKSRIINDKETKIINLVSNFQSHLLKNKHFDDALLFKTAIDLLNDSNNPLYFSKDVVIGLFSPLSKKLTYLEATFLEAFSKRLDSDIYTLKQEEKKPDIHKIKAYGFSSEINYIASLIKTERININDVSIYISDSKYKNLIKGIFENNGIPYRFKDGDYALCDETINVFDAILDFLLNHYSISSLYRILQSPLLDEKYKFINKLSNLKADKNQLIYIVQDSLKKSPEDALLTHGQCLFLLSLVDVNHELVEETIDEALVFIKKFFVNYSEKGIAYIESVKREIALMPKSFKRIEIIKAIKDELTNAKIDSESTNEYVYVSHLSSLDYLHRKYVFFVGLSSSQINQKEIESPLCSDKTLSERLDNDYYISLARNKNTEFLNNIKDVISHFDGHLYLIRSQYDSVDFKDLTPSSLYLELPGKEISDNSYLTQKISRKLSTLTPKTLISDEVVSILKQKKRFSPSAIESLMSCPLAFIIKYSNLFDEIDLDEYDGFWLRGNEKGTLAHLILENYFVTNPKEFDSKLFNEAVKNAGEATIRTHPFDSRKIMEKEIAAIARKCKEYLLRYYGDENNQKYNVIAREENCLFDYDLAVKEDKILHYQITGIIDRIDGYVENGVLHLRFVDYKTTNENTLKAKLNNHTLSQIYLYPLFAKKFVFKRRDLIVAKCGEFDEVNYNHVPFVYELLYGKTTHSLVCKPEHINEFKSMIEKSLIHLDAFLDNPTLETLCAINPNYGDTQIASDNFDSSICKYCKFGLNCPIKIDNGETAVVKETKKNADATA